MSKVVRFSEFKKLNELSNYNQYGNTTGFANSLTGRGIMSLVKWFRKGVNLFRLEYFRRRLENEIVAGILRDYSNALEDFEGQEEKGQEEPKSQEEKKIIVDYQCPKLFQEMDRPLWDEYYEHMKIIGMGKNYGVEVPSDDILMKLPVECENLIKLQNKYTSELDDGRVQLRTMRQTYDSKSSGGVSGEEELKKAKNSLDLWECIVGIANNMLKTIERLIVIKKCTDEGNMKELPPHNIKQITAGSNIVKYDYKGKEIMVIKTKDGQLVTVDEKGQIVKFNKDNVPEVINPDIVTSQESIIGLFSIYMNDPSKIENNTKIVVNLVNKLDLTDSGIGEIITNLYKISKSSGVLEKYPEFGKFLKDKLLKIRGAQTVNVNDSFRVSYDDFLNEMGMTSTKPTTGVLDKLSGYRKIFGEKDLNWDLLGSKDMDDVVNYYMDKTKGKERRESATNMVNLNAIAAIANSVEGIIYNIEPNPSTKLTPGTGGGITGNETALARKWRKMVNNTLARFKYFVNTDKVDPLRMDVKAGGKEVKKYADKMSGEVDDTINIVKCIENNKGRLIKNVKVSDNNNDLKNYLMYVFCHEGKTLIMRLVSHNDGKPIFKIMNEIMDTEDPKKVVKGELDDKGNYKAFYCYFPRLITASNTDKKKLTKIKLYVGGDNPRFLKDMDMHYYTYIFLKVDIDETEMFKKSLDFKTVNVNGKDVLSDEIIKLITPKK